MNNISTNYDNNYIVLTPYLIPSRLAKNKIVNIGDGFILRSIERLIGRTPNNNLFTSRDPLVLQLRDDNAGIILAGANQLSDNFSVWPGASSETIRKSQLRIIPFGIGLHGIPNMNQGMSLSAHEQLEAIHERLEFSSWRCPRTVAYLEESIPALRGRFLMTGCPVTYDKPILTSSIFHSGESNIAVTVTERENFWDREMSTLEFVAHQFPRANRWLVLHQNYDPPTKLETIMGPSLCSFLKSPVVRLRSLARKMGFQVIAPSSADEALSFYQGIDMHFGSRLHAHLNMLSQNKRSWLTYVDDRCIGIAESLDFPVCEPSELSSHLGYNFERIRVRAIENYQKMHLFLRSIKP